MLLAFLNRSERKIFLYYRIGPVYNRQLIGHRAIREACNGIGGNGYDLGNADTMK